MDSPTLIALEAPLTPVHARRRFAYRPVVGQRSSTETALGIIAAFIDRPTWSQAELARKLETRPETIRKQLGELLAGGLPLHREEDHPHVYWSVPKNWIPGAIAFKDTELRDLLRLIARAPRGALRTRIMEVIVARLPFRADAAGSVDPSTIQSPAIAPEEERWLDVLEDAASRRQSIKMRYFSASRGKEKWRHASVQRVDLHARAQFVAVCHEANALRRFRLSNVLEARVASAEPFRQATNAELAKFDRDSFGGFHDVGPKAHCSFFVRDPEAAWVSKNLPDERIVTSSVPGGSRFSVETTAVSSLARFVVSLGEIARPETPELVSEVAAIARAALTNATAPAPRPATDTQSQHTTS